MFYSTDLLTAKGGKFNMIWLLGVSVSQEKKRKLEEKLMLANDLIEQNMELRRMLPVRGKERSFSLHVNSILLHGLSINLKFKVDFVYRRINQNKSTRREEVQEIDCLPGTEAYVLPAEMAVDIDWGRMKNRVDMYQLPSELELGNSIDLPSQGAFDAFGGSMLDNGFGEILPRGNGETSDLLDNFLESEAGGITLQVSAQDKIDIPAPDLEVSAEEEKKDGRPGGRKRSADDDVANPKKGKKSPRRDEVTIMQEEDENMIPDAPLRPRVPTQLDLVTPALEIQKRRRTPRNLFSGDNSQDEQPEIQDKNLENDVFLPDNIGMEVPLNVDIEVPMDTDIQEPLNVDIEVPMNMDIQEPLNMDIDVPNMDIQVPTVREVSEQIETEQEAGEPGIGEEPIDRPAAGNDNETPTEVLRPLVLKKKKESTRQPRNMLKIDKDKQLSMETIHANLNNDGDLLLKKDSVSIGLSFNFSGSGRKFGGSLSKHWDKQLRVCKTVTVNDFEEDMIMRNISANNSNNISAISAIGQNSRLSLNTSINRSQDGLEPRQSKEPPRLDIITEKSQENSVQIGDPDITPQDIIAVGQPHQEDITDVLPPQENIADVQPPQGDIADVLPPQEDIADVLPPLEDIADVLPPLEDITDVLPPQEDIAEVLPPQEGHDDIPPPDGFPDDVQRTDEFAFEKEMEILATSTREFLNAVEEVCEEKNDEFFTYFSTVCPPEHTQRSKGATSFFSMLTLEKKECLRTEQEQFVGPIKIKLLQKAAEFESHTETSSSGSRSSSIQGSFQEM
ncbi:uncharacterized protein LOC111703414 isoform X2 [Eurytemora carolleeae]|uniref:uncharacterized protein LOC111703414 isoform X2 n=1 Tax=Eurytemora carolleeae TaxID=1294199 RepID=UPI000C77C453|nr:uncharacterized protein LOC111703414 isoform X2 [Eurytemora carolleeae]|eukprot:XP_023331123.1 uncharacterized protein LOC111703414 isoform X2 [Eurytemora affinis]